MEFKKSYLFLELFYARQAVVTAAKAFKLQAIDLVYIDYKVTNYTTYINRKHLG